jgi:hypothetical protein
MGVKALDDTINLVEELIIEELEVLVSCFSLSIYLYIY